MNIIMRQVIISDNGAAYYISWREYFVATLSVHMQNRALRHSIRMFYDIVKYVKREAQNRD